MSDALKVVLALLPAVGLFFFVRATVKRRIRAAMAAAESAAATARAGLEERLRGREEALAEARATLARAAAKEEQLEERVADLRAALAGQEEKLRAFAEAEQKLTDAFQNLASQALSRNNQQFLALAQENLAKLQGEAKGELEQRQQAIAALVAPLHEALGKVDEQSRRIEATRTEAYGSLTEQVKALHATQERLHLETGNLVKALRAPQARGRWGEMQLKRVVEFAGMVDRVDFVEQETVGDDEASQRPDLIVRLPGGKNLVVDAKAPLAAYLDALEARDEEVRLARLKDHARQVREHIKKLSAKKYWSQFTPAPEFVVLFLPSESLFSAALEQDPTLIDESFSQSVVLATPTTLIALLKSVSYGWRQEALAENARQIAVEARTLYDRVRVFAEHLDRVGKGLEDAVRAHNQASSSFVSRVLPQGRKLEELGAVDARPIVPPRQLGAITDGADAAQVAESDLIDSAAEPRRDRIGS